MLLLILLRATFYLPVILAALRLAVDAKRTHSLYMMTMNEHTTSIHTYTHLLPL